MIIVVSAQSEVAEADLEAALLSVLDITDQVESREGLLVLVLSEGRSDQLLGHLLQQHGVSYYRYHGGVRNEHRHLAAVTNSNFVVLVGEGRGVSRVKKAAESMDISIMSFEG